MSFLLSEFEALIRNKGGSLVTESDDRRVIVTGTDEGRVATWIEATFDNGKLVWLAAGSGLTGDKGESDIYVDDVDMKAQQSLAWDVCVAIVKRGYECEIWAHKLVGKRGRVRSVLVLPGGEVYEKQMQGLAFPLLAATAHVTRVVVPPFGSS